MKQLFVLLSGLLLAGNLHAQHSAEYASTKLEVKSDYNESANGLARTAADYVLATKPDKESRERLLAMAYLMRWMAGTPDYTFALSDHIGKVIKGNDDLLPVYMAAMTKFCLAYPDQKADREQVELASFRALVAYCKEQSIKMKGELKKIAAAEEKGKLEEYLKG